MNILAAKHLKLGICIINCHYENMPIQIYWKFYHQKNNNFQIKNSDILHISAQNINCEYALQPSLQDSSNEYPQFMFLYQNKQNNVYPCKRQWGLRGSKLYRHVFVMVKDFLESYHS